MNRRHALHVAALLALAVAVRVALFHYVGVWGDAGFYTYDAQLLLAGQTPFVDFIGRSPLFNYGYASVASVTGTGMVSLRSFIVVWWLLAGVPVYLIARKIHGHAAGLAALALFEFSPFMLVYGYWANTQSLAAFLAAAAVATVLYRPRALGYLGGGVLLGAAFLTRRSVITIVAAVALYAVYLAYRDRDVTAAGVRVAAVGVGFSAALAVGYLALARGAPGLAAKLAETHAWGLISSSGRGGFPLLTEGAPAEPLNRLDTGRIPIFNDVCQLCGAWTVRVFVKTTVAAVVVVGPLLYYARDGFERAVPRPLHWWAGAGTLAIVTYASLRAIQAGYALRVGAVVSLAGFGYVVATTRPPSPPVLYGREMALPLVVAGGLAAGYLYRNRIIHTYYFADLMPYVSVVAGVLLVHMVREVRR